MLSRDFFWYHIDTVFVKYFKGQNSLGKGEVFCLFVTDKLSKIIKWGSLILFSYEFKTILMICLARKKTAK